MIIKNNKAFTILELVLAIITMALFGGLLVAIATKVFKVSDNDIKSDTSIQCGMNDVLKEECKDKLTVNKQ